MIIENGNFRQLVLLCWVSTFNRNFLSLKYSISRRKNRLKIVLKHISCCMIHASYQNFKLFQTK